MTRPYCKRPGGCVAPKHGMCPLCQKGAINDVVHTMSKSGGRKGLETKAQQAREAARPITVAPVLWGRG
jgi:hypothetical protein